MKKIGFLIVVALSLTLVTGHLNGQKSPSKAALGPPATKARLESAAGGRQHGSPVTENRPDRIVVSKRDQPDPERIYLEKLQTQLGSDLIGKTALSLIGRVVETHKGREPASITNADCSTQVSCPEDLKLLYSESLSRLSTSDFANAKALLQESMLLSELPLNSKVELLTKELLNPELKDIPSSTWTDESGTVHLSADSLYLLATQNRLMQLNPEPNVAIEASLSAISSVQTEELRLLASLNLMKRYPDQRKYISQYLYRIGLPQDILE